MPLVPFKTYAERHQAGQQYPIRDLGPGDTVAPMPSVIAPFPDRPGLLPPTDFTPRPPVDPAAPRVAGLVPFKTYASRTQPAPVAAPVVPPSPAPVTARPAPPPIEPPTPISSGVPDDLRTAQTALGIAVPATGALARLTDNPDLAGVASGLAGLQGAARIAGVATNDRMSDEQKIMESLAALGQGARGVTGLLPSDMRQDVSGVGGILGGLGTIGGAIASDADDAMKALDAARGGLQIATGAEALGWTGTLPATTVGAGAPIDAMGAGVDIGGTAAGSIIGTIADAVPYVYAAISVAQTAMDDRMSDEQKAVNSGLDAAAAVLSLASGGSSFMFAAALKYYLAKTVFIHEPSHEERELVETRGTAAGAKGLLHAVEAADTPEELHQALVRWHGGQPAEGQLRPILSTLGDRRTIDLTPDELFQGLLAEPDQFAAQVQAGIETGRKFPMDSVIAKVVRTQARLISAVTPMRDQLRQSTGYDDLTIHDVLSVVRNPSGPSAALAEDVIRARQTRVVSETIDPLFREGRMSQLGIGSAQRNYDPDMRYVPQLATEYRVGEEAVADAVRRAQSWLPEDQRPIPGPESDAPPGFVFQGMNDEGMPIFRRPDEIDPRIPIPIPPDAP